MFHFFSNIITNLKADSFILNLISIQLESLVTASSDNIFLSKGKARVMAPKNFTS